MDDLEQNSVSKLEKNALQWTGNLNDTIYSYYSGMWLSQGLAAFYIGQPLVTTTNEIVHFQPTWLQLLWQLFGGKNYTKGILTIPASRLWVYPEIPEIDREAGAGLEYLLQRLIRSVIGFYLTYANDASRYIPLYPMNETGSVVNYTVSLSKCSLGQTTDIAAFHSRYMHLTRLNPKNIVVYGVSRGAATSFAALADQKYNNIKLCILEGPPGSISSLFKCYFSHLLGPLLYNPFIAYLFLGQQHKIDKDSQAIARADKFPLDIPLVIISSQNDEVVCQKSSLNIALRVAANRQRATGPIAEVYFLQLDAPLHNYYTRGNTYDSHRYENFIHAIYRKYNLPFIEQFANAGEHELSVAELTQGPLKENVVLQFMFKKHKNNRELIRERARDLLKEQTNTLDEGIRVRAARICAQMPLYTKTINTSFFQKNRSQSKETNPFSTADVSEPKAWEMSFAP